VAGRFYPDDPERLTSAIDALLAAAGPCEPTDTPKAIIAPHAGYPYSGPIAASAYAHLRVPGATVERVVLLGPAHWWPAPGIAVPSCSAFRTPLGDVPVDATAISRLAELDFIQVVDEAHEREHAIEVQLPFLQRVLTSAFTLVPLLVGHVSNEQLDAVYEALWGGPETLIVVSSDLSHFHDYETARQLDGATSEAIEAMQPEAIEETSACGRLPIQGLLRMAQRRQLRTTAVDVRSSGDTAGSRDKVVGYGAYILG
jgi:hypothetical protein